MKTLLILRHGAVGPIEPGVVDRDRPLTPAGRDQVSRIGKALKDRGIIPDEVMTSPAVRAQQTTELLLDAIGSRPPVSTESSIYQARPDALLALIRQAPPEANRLLLVGHNPGFQELVALLTDGGTPNAPISLPVCGMACIPFDIDRWSEVDPGGGTLQWLLTPAGVA